MYNADQYARAKAQVDAAPPEAQAVLRQRMGEYEASTRDRAAAFGGTIEPGMEVKPVAAPAHGDFVKPVNKLDELTAQVNAPDPNADDTTDLNLPNASKLKVFNQPAEYVAKNKLAGLAHIASASVLAGVNPLYRTTKSPLAANMYYEPSEERFQQEAGPEIAARKLVPGTPEYQQKFDEYKDRKWQQAYEQAAAQDRPLTRAEYVQHAPGWAALGDFVANGSDEALSFAKGIANTLSLHGAMSAPSAAEDYLTRKANPRGQGTSRVLDNREEEARNPASSVGGEVAGAFLPIGPVAEAAGAAGKLVTRGAPGMLRRLAGSVVGAQAGAGADLAGRSVARGLEDVSQGGDTSSARSQFMSNLLPTMALATGGGIAGHAIAGLGEVAAKHIVAGTPEIADLHAGGAATHPIWGVTPGREVAANIEQARPPLLGEEKAMLPGTPNATVIQASKLQGPLTAENAAAHADAHELVRAQQDAMIAGDPGLQRRLFPKESGNATITWILKHLKPEAKESYLPHLNDATPDQLAPFGDVKLPQKLAQELYSPAIVTAPEAMGMAARARGRAVTFDEARALGYDVGALAKKQGLKTTIAEGLKPGPSGLDTQGVPRGAPDLESEGLATRIGEPPTTADVFGRPADEITPPRPRTTLSPRPEKAFKGAAPETIDGDPFGIDAKRTGDYFKDHPRELPDPFPADRFGGWKSSVPSVAPKDLQARILDAAEGIGKQRVRLADLREALPDVPREELDKALKDSQQAGNLVLMRLDNPQEIGPRDLSGKLDIAGADRHILYLTPEGRARISAKETSVAAPESYHTRVSPPSEPGPISATPSGPPPELRAASEPSAPASAVPSKPFQGPTQQVSHINGIPTSEYRIVLKPNPLNAREFEDVLGRADMAAKADQARGKIDPELKIMQAAIRQDRNQFGEPWVKLIDEHHNLLNGLEKRSADAGINEKVGYHEGMSKAGRLQLDAQLEGYPGHKNAADAAAKVALTSLASGADARAARVAQAAGGNAPPPGVLHDLEVLAAQNAYTKLKGEAVPKLNESAGAAGLTAHLRGLGPFMKLRVEPIARALATGPTGEPTISNRLLNYVRQSSPASRMLPGIGVGGGALGMRLGVGYNAASDHLTDSQKATLAKMLLAFDQKPQATPEAP